MLDPNFYADLDAMHEALRWMRDHEPVHFVGAIGEFGAPLARLELRVLLEELTSRITGLHLRSPLDIEPNIFASAVRRFERR